MSSETEKHIKMILSILPDKPGCYQYFDDKGTIIYVGKAKNLKRRVSSYFNKEHDSNKTRVLVKQIRDIKYIVVNTEEDALLLENNLIKQYRPRYNVMLKDDKTYPSITVKTNIFPHISDPEYSKGWLTILRPLPVRIHCQSHASDAEGTLPVTYLQISIDTGIYCSREIRGLPGIPYQTLQRALRRFAIYGRIPAKHFRNKGNPSRKYLPDQ